MSAEHHDVRLLRGYKIRLLRVPPRPPGRTGADLLEGSPRFVPFLLERKAQERSAAAPFELRAYPGPPLGREREITYLDAALLASASLFSLLLSPAGLLLLRAHNSPPFLRQHKTLRQTRDRLEGILKARDGKHEWPNLLDDYVWSELARLQTELINAFSHYKQRKNARVASRKRALIPAFRAENLRVNPSVGNAGELRKMVRDYINSILASKACAGYRPLKRGYARTHGGLMNKMPMNERPKRSEPSLLLFSPCKTPEGVSLFYSDLEIRLLRYAKLSKPAPQKDPASTENKCVNLLAKAEALLSVAGRGDFIQMPLLWWGQGGRNTPTYRAFIRHLLNHSKVLQFVIFSLGSLFLQNTKELLQAFPQCPTFGHARLLLEAGLAHLYYAVSAEQQQGHTPSEIIKLALKDTLDSAPRRAKEFVSFTSKYRWGGAWGLPETIIFISRAPLPPQIVELQHPTHRGASGPTLAEEIRSLENALPN